MRRPRGPPGARTVVFVEGGDEERLGRALLGARADDVFWMTFDGNSTQIIHDRVSAAVRDPNWPGIHNYGVIIDAEEPGPDPAEPLAPALALVAAAFAALRAPMPTKSGVIEPNGSVVAGYYLLPDNAAPGALETLLRRSADPVVAGCVDALFQCTANPGTTTALRDKAWVGAYLGAKCANPRVDQAWSNGALDPSHAALKRLRAFLLALL